jgi:hypothetical protein
MPHDRSLVKERGLRGEALSCLQKRPEPEFNTNNFDQISSLCTICACSHTYTRGGDTYPTGRRTPIFLIRETTDCPNDPAVAPRYNHCVVYGKIKRGMIRPRSHVPACGTKNYGASASKLPEYYFPRSQNRISSYAILLHPLREI